ncbi:MAG: hypothetical protein ACT4OS_10010 [Acidimicrobiales bacterium]
MSSSASPQAIASGESPAVAERVIVAPVPGRFRPETGADIDLDGVIGFIDGPGQSTPVRSAFAGRFMGLMAHAGERVREGQPVAWLRLA